MASFILMRNLHKIVDANIKKGYKIRSAGNIEVLLHPDEDKGSDRVHDLRSMYAFAIETQKNMFFGTTLNELFNMIKAFIGEYDSKVKSAEPLYGSFRSGALRYTQADISKAKKFVGIQSFLDLSSKLSALSWPLGDKQ